MELAPHLVLELALAIIVAGAVSGFLAGLFGVGGGAIIVPILYWAFQIAFASLHIGDATILKLCIGTSLAIIVPTSVRSLSKHRAKGAADMAVLRGWALPIIIGVVVGLIILRYAPGALLKSLFVLVAGFNGVRLILGRDDWRLKGDINQGAALTLSGLLIGALSSLMGIGGGQLAALYMSLYGRPIHQVVATTAGVGVLVSVPGALGAIIVGWPDMAHLPPLSLGYVSLLGVALMIPSSLLFAPMGVNFAHRLSKRGLEMAFGVFLLLVALRFALSLLGI